MKIDFLFLLLIRKQIEMFRKRKNIHQMMWIILRVFMKDRYI